MNFGTFFGGFLRAFGLTFGASPSGVWVGKKFGPLRVGFDLFRFKRR